MIKKNWGDRRLYARRGRPNRLSQSQLDRPNAQAIPTPIKSIRMRIRHFGLMAHRCRKAKLAQMRQALEVERTKPPPVATAPAGPGSPCLECESGFLFVISALPPSPRR